MRLRSLLLGSILVLALSPTAVARTHFVAPPGNSAVTQYVEAIPTAGGGRPTNTIHGVGGHSGGSGGSGGGVTGLFAGDPTGSVGGGSASSSGAAPSAGVVPVSTQQSLARHGRDGAAAIGLARATGLPFSGRSHRGSGGSSNPAFLNENGWSPTSGVLHALTGSAAGGLGAILPIILIVSALGAGALALHRHRRTV